MASMVIIKRQSRAAVAMQTRMQIQLAPMRRVAQNTRTNSRMEAQEVEDRTMQVNIQLARMLDSL